MGGANAGLVTQVSCVINGRQFRVINKTQTQHRLPELGGRGYSFSPLPLSAPPPDPPCGFPWRSAGAALTDGSGQRRLPRTTGGATAASPRPHLPDRLGAS